jgi:hypothetical protein
MPVGTAAILESSGGLRPQSPDMVAAETSFRAAADLGYMSIRGEAPTDSAVPQCDRR